MKLDSQVQEKGGSKEERETEAAKINKGNEEE